MAVKTIEETKMVGSNTMIYGFVIDDNKPTEKLPVYIVNQNKRIIEYFPRSAKYYFFDKVTLLGFSQLPSFLKKGGYSKNRILDFINRAFKDKKIKSLTITKAGGTNVVKRKKDKHLHVSYKSIYRLCDDIGSSNYRYSRERTALVNKHFANELPDLIKTPSVQNGKEQIKRAIQSLNIQSEKDFEKDDVNNITTLLTNLMKSGYKSQITKSKLFKNTKIQFDFVTLDEIIKEFESNMQKKISESDWGKFLDNNLTLIDSKYIHSIPQLNVVLGGTRKVDFGLVDILGYLDIFEIKKPETKLLTKNKDSRGNYEWNKEALESITQAEKYLFHAERKGANLKEDIKRERNIPLEIIRPRAFVIMGHSDQLDNDSKKQDFRILKNQFKNIEIILYDELLERLKNQKKSIEST